MVRVDSQEARILSAIQNIADGYLGLSSDKFERPPLLDTFITSKAVIEKTLELNGISDPDLPALLAVLLMTAKHFLEPAVAAQGKLSREEAVGALWRDRFLSTVDVNGGVPAFIKALDHTNDVVTAAVIKSIFSS